MRRVIVVVFALFIGGWLWLDARAQQANGQLVRGAHRFEKVADGIYYATASGTMNVGANSPVIVADNEAIVIDSETSPAAGRALVQDIKAFTDKPVKYVIDSHFHYDHLFGNQVFGPDVQVIGHDHTRVRLQANTMEQFTFRNSINPARLDGRAQSGGPVVSGAHRFEKVIDGVYYATASGTMNVGANSPIIVSGDETLVIDSEITPAAARALVADLKAITDKPVRYVVDSHYHYDHSHGNQIFMKDAQVIGHDNTRTRMQGNVLEQYTYLNSVKPIPDRVAGLRQRIAQESDPQQKKALEQQVANALAYLEQVKETRVTPPAVTFDKTMTIVKGGREMRLLFLGRGHTDTDVVVYLPRERIVCTGDLMESVVSYMGDSFPEDWIATLERLKALDFDTVMPGHGVVFHGKGKIDAFQKYLRDVITQATAMKKQGLSADEAAQKIDVTAYKNEFASIRGVGVDPAGVRRIYQLADRPE